MLDDNKRKKLRVSVIAAALAALPAFSAHAAGLGKLTVLSALGQPLRAELDISASREEVASITAKIASQESFRQANIEYSGTLSTLRFTLDKRSNGQPYFRVSSDRPIGDPFLDLLVELNWSSGRLIREYTFLLDPPELNKPVETPAPVNAPVSAPTAMAPVKPEVEKPAPMPAEKPAKKAADSVAEKPASRPSPKVAAAPAEHSAASTREVHKGDTLGKIAAETRPDGVSLDQMLVALFRGNQEAFEGGNMNRLKAGKILSVPEKDAVAAVDAGEARKVILAQAADFDAYRSKLAGAVASAKPAKEEAPAQVSSGKITPKVEDKVPVAAGKDKLQVSRTETSGDAAKTKALEEEKVAKDKALKEAQSRIAELEKNVADMRKLAELKSQAAADLQKQAAKAAPAVEAKKPEPAKPVEAPTKPTEPPKAVEAAKPVEPPKPAEVAKAPEEAAKSAETAKPADAPPPPPAAAKKPVAPPPPPPEPSFLEDNGALVFGGGGVLALLAGYMGFSAWKRRRAAKAVASAESVLSASSVLDVTSSEGMSQIDAQPSEFGEAAEASFGSGEGIDPIREADTFMAYGRDAQAEEILVDALAKTPENLPVYLKLLEIYAARKSVSQFNAIAEKLNEQTHGAGPEWERAVTLGRVVAPDYVLYAAAPVEASEVSAPSVSGEVATAPEHEEAAALDLDFDLADAAPASENEGEAVAAPVSETAQTPAPDAGLDMDFSAVSDAAVPETIAAVTEVVEAGSEPATSDEPAALDFDLDLGAEPATSEPAPAPAPVAAVDAGMEMDFDLGDLSAAPAPVEAPAAEPAPVAPGNSLDFDLDLGASPAPEAAATPAVEPAAGGGLDLDFDLDLGSPAAEAAAVAATESAGVAAAPLDFNFDLDVPAVEAATPAMDITLDLPADAPALNLDGISLDLSEPLAEASALVPPADDAGEADNPEVTTKLELAQAYEEMGDKEGAKELFQEVLAEGSTAQKALAQEKLSKLS